MCAQGGGDGTEGDDDVAGGVPIWLRTTVLANEGHLRAGCGQVAAVGIGLGLNPCLELNRFGVCWEVCGSCCELGDLTHSPVDLTASVVSRTLTLYEHEGCCRPSVSAFLSNRSTMHRSAPRYEDRH